MKKFFSKPAVALVLTLVLAVTSVLLNTRVHLGKKSDALCEEFYREGSVSGQLAGLCTAAEQLVQLGTRYQLDDAEAASEKIAQIRDLTRLHSHHAGEIFAQYEGLLRDVFSLESALARIQLSEADAESFVTAQHQAAEIKAAIDSSSYNDLVQRFNKKNLHFPTPQLARLSGVSLPEYFA